MVSKASHDDIRGPYDPKASIAIGSILLDYSLETAGRVHVEGFGAYPDDLAIART